MTAVAIPARTRGPATRSRRPAPRRGHLALVEVPGRFRTRRRALLGIACIAVLALFTIVAFHALLAQSQVAIDRLDQETAVAQRRYEQARYAHASLASPDRIVRRAAELGLVPPAGPPVAVPMSGNLPTDAAGTASTLHGWTEVKPTLADAP